MRMLISIECRAEAIVNALIPHIVLAVEGGLLSENEAEDLVVGEVIDSIEVRVEERGEDG